MIRLFSINGIREKTFLVTLSFVIVAFGQPAWSEWLSLLAAFVGFAGFWRVLLEIPSRKKRFFLSLGWYGAIQWVQLSWFLSHPYWYIYGVVLFCSLLIGVQGGIFSLWIQRRTFDSIFNLIALAGLWTIFEWSRLFILSGLPFNPVGLTLSSSIYSLQFAAIGGMYGLSFWVILTNLLVLRAWMLHRFLAATTIAAVPFVFGWGHLYWHDLKQEQTSIDVVLVQPASPIEEQLLFKSAEEYREFVLQEWKHSLQTLQKQQGQKIDLIVFPEYMVPFGTYHHVFPIDEITSLFYELFGDVSSAFPVHHPSYVDLFATDKGEQWLVSNAYLGQAVANVFHAHVVMGLEDSMYVNKRKKESYSAAFHFTPDSKHLPGRYEKQILAPMGEYIPFSWAKALAARYGISGSFTCGTCARVFEGPVPFGASICYEELYGNLMRENRLKGAELLVNLTNDGWYPASRLPKQHFDHARLRTVENGIPLVRSCNTGVTGAIDSLGRVIACLGDSIESQEIADSIRIAVPCYHYQTVYSRYGDASVLISSCLAICVVLWRTRKVR